MMLIGKTCVQYCESIAVVSHVYFSEKNNTYPSPWIADASGLQSSFCREEKAVLMHVPTKSSNGRKDLVPILLSLCVYVATAVFFLSANPWCLYSNCIMGQLLIAASCIF